MFEREFIEGFIADSEDEFVRNGGHLAMTFFAKCPDGIFTVTPVGGKEDDDEFMKEVLEGVKKVFEEKEVDSYILVSEGWGAAPAGPSDIRSPAKREDKINIVSYLFVDQDGEQLFTRRILEEDGVKKLSEEVMQHLTHMMFVGDTPAMSSLIPQKKRVLQ